MLFGLHFMSHLTLHNAVHNTYAILTYEGHRDKIKVTEKSRTSLLPQCKTSIRHNSASIKHLL